jgi:hypothetical protein
MAISLYKKLAWFDGGAAAFERTFPGVLREILADDAPRYVCPLCDEPFRREAVLSGDLTAEHVPPDSFGGRELLLTCRVCNNTAGTSVDGHARKRENIAEAKIGNVAQRLAVRIELLDVKLQARLEPSASGAQLEISKANNNPAALESLQKVGVIPAGTPLTIEFVRDRYSELRANISWLRSGFLALFSIIGYEFSFDPAIRIVKEQLRSPNKRLIDCFTISPRGSVASNWVLVEISDPHCTAVMFGPYVVILPPPRDLDFYQRVAEDARAQEAGAPRRTTKVLQTIALTRWEPVFSVEIPDSL